MIVDQCSPNSVLGASGAFFEVNGTHIVSVVGHSRRARIVRRDFVPYKTSMYTTANSRGVGTARRKCHRENGPRTKSLVHFVNVTIAIRQRFP